MAATLGEAYVNIIPKAPGIESSLKKMFDDASGKAGEHAGKNLGQKILSGLKTAGITAGVGKILKDAFAAGGDLQQSFGGLETIYGEAAEGAKKYAQEAAAVGLSANSYAEQAVSFGAALKQAYGGDTTAAMEAANTAIMDMTDNAAKMGTPMQDIQNAYQGFAKQNYTMLDNLKLGYGGTKSEMERLLAEAQEITGIEYNIDNLGDVYDAIHVIQEDLGITGVAAEEAKTTLTGSLSSVKASWTNVMAAMTTGEGLDTAMSNLSTSVGYLIENVITMFGRVAEQAPTIISGLLDAIIANAPTLLTGGAEIIVALLDGLLSSIPSLLGAIPDILLQVGQAFLDHDWNSLGGEIIQGIVVGVVYSAGVLLSALRDLATQALNAAKSALGIASPSKVFANEVGKWIPRGMAAGVEANLSPVNSSINRMAAAATNEFSRAQAPGAVAAASYADSASSRATPAAVAPTVTIEFTGSLSQLGRVLQPHIKQENQRIGETYAMA